MFDAVRNLLVPIVVIQSMHFDQTEANRDYKA